MPGKLCLGSPQGQQTLREVAGQQSHGSASWWDAHVAFGTESRTGGGSRDRAVLLAPWAPGQQHVASVRSVPRLQQVPGLRAGEVSLRGQCVLRGMSPLCPCLVGPKGPTCVGFCSRPGAHLPGVPEVLLWRQCLWVWGWRTPALELGTTCPRGDPCSCHQRVCVQGPVCLERLGGVAST